MADKKVEKKVEEYPTVVEHLVKGNKTIVKLSNGKVGVAACSPEDEFDPYEGFRLASARAYGKEEPFKKKNVIKEVERHAKVGEYIKITHDSPLGSFYKKGDIFKVYKENNGVFSGVYCELKNKIKILSNDNGNILIFDTEYVVLEGYDPKKENK